jgi:hypothetical protein
LSKFHDFETIMETMSIINTYFEFIVQLNWYVYFVSEITLNIH